MPKVNLSSVIRDDARRLWLVGEREVDLPCPPFVGLEVILSEVEHFEIAKVAYDPATDEWFAEEKDHHIAADQSAITNRGLPPETIELLQEILEEAGFRTEIVSSEVPRRHLRLVRRDE